jgi:hypothetical protein
MSTDLSSVDLNVVLLHEKMVDKHAKLVTTSLTMIDVHDFARSSKTYGLTKTFIAHPSPATRKLARSLQQHWECGLGLQYNPNRSEALSIVEIVSSLDEAIQRIDQRCGKLPKLIATSAKKGPDRISYPAMRQEIETQQLPFLLMFGTGWGMSEELLKRADYLLEPICGPTEFNHLSVRGACSIILDRLRGC